MPEANEYRCRLCLVTPVGNDDDRLPALLEAALDGGDVASLIITGTDAALAERAAKLTPIAQARGVAVLVQNDTQIAGRAKADGLHIDTGLADLKDAIDNYRPDKIVGAGDLHTRHDAMAAGEADPDYVFFGRLDGDGDVGIYPTALDLAAWWSALFVVPAMVMGGGSPESVQQAAESGVDFVALGRAVWEHPQGPSAAVAEANRLLALSGDKAA